MTKTISWPARAMYIALALALAFSLAAVAISPATVDAYGETKWSKVTTPSIDDLVIQPGTDIIDFVASEDGDVIYAVLDGVLDNAANHDFCGDSFNNCENGYGDAVVKSEDGGVTWDDITDEVQEEGIYYPMMVAVAPGDADFVFVTGYADDDDNYEWDPCDGDGADPTNDSEPYMVIGSDDGGDDFSDMVFDAIAGGEVILCIAVAPETGDAYNVAVGTDMGSIWRYKVGGTFGGSWADTTTYQGWDNEPGPSMTTTAIIDIAFSPAFDSDDTVAVITTDTTFSSDGNGDDGETYMQFGIWGTTKAWNAEAGSPFTSAVQIMDAPPFGDNGLRTNAYDEADHAAGMAMPTDFMGYDSGNRYTWVYLNYDADDSGDTSMDVPASFQNEFDEVGQVFQVKGSSVDYAGVRCEPWDTSDTYPLISSIAMTGEIDEGAIMVGMQGPTAECAGINVTSQ